MDVNMVTAAVHDITGLLTSTLATSSEMAHNTVDISSTSIQGQLVTVTDDSGLTTAKLGGGCMIQMPQDFSNDIITPRTALIISVINTAFLTPVLFLVGAVGNVLSAAVFYKQGLRERINLCLFYLAIADFLTIFFSVFLAVESAYRDLVGPHSFFITYFVGLTGFTWVSMFLSTVIASERCFCVVSPLHAQRYVKTRTMAIFITVVSALLLTGMLGIAGPKHTTACVFNPVTNVTSEIIYVTKYFLDRQKLLDALDVFLYALALPLFFIVTIIISTAITAVKIHSAAKWRRETAKGEGGGKASGGGAADKKESREVALTKMLIGTSVLFILCLTPMYSVQVAMFAEPELQYGKKYHNMCAALWTIIPTFRCMNSALNFFVYYSMGSRFRQTLKQVLSCCCCRTESGAEAGTNSVTTMSTINAEASSKTTKY